MKPQIAVIWFPGTNCDEEAIHAIEAAGMQPVFVRWNQKDVKNFDGYFIPGGWSYEDRIRAGIIAAKDPIMKTIKEQAETGKPVLGICNGCQILVETAMIPGLKDEVELAMAPSIEGYYCVWTNMINLTNKTCAYNLNMDKNQIIKAPIAHGEGRFFTKNESLFKELEKNKQIIFKFCDEKGKIVDDMEVNPNGAMHNIAAICNKEGNVMAMMPHPERASWFKNIPYFEQNSFEENEKMTSSNSVFASMKKFIENGN